MSGKKELKTSTGQVDFILLVLILSLLLFGFVMLFSASSPSVADSGVGRMLIRQGAIIAMGSFLMGFAMINDYHMYVKLNGTLFVGSVVVMFLVAFIGFASHGATRQISLGFISFQPSEFSKIVLILYFAARFSRKSTQNVVDDWKNIGWCACVLGLYGFACLLQSHMSAAIVLILIGALMMIAAGFPMKWTLIGGSVGGLFATLFIVTEEYRLNRVLALFNPFKYKQSIGWQIVQSLYAVGSGGLFGLGLGQSRQKFKYLPEAQNDYIYAVVCEELGFIGGVVVILLFVLFVWRGISIALNAKDRFGMYTAFGITCMVGLQMLINIGVVLSVLPSTGMQLPLFSSGGSSLLATMWGMGILLNISKTSKIKKI